MGLAIANEEPGYRTRILTRTEITYYAGRFLG